MQSPRIEPRPIEGLTDEMWQTLGQIPGDGLKSEGFPRNVLGTLLHNPEVLGPFLAYWVKSKHALSLSVREQELVILRMGSLFDCEYVWKHHVLVGREFGITDDELAALRACPRAFARGPAASMSAREVALVALTDELVEARTIGEDAWSRFGLRLEERNVVDLISLVSQYTLFALVNNGARVLVEAPLASLPSVRMFSSEW